MMNLVVGDADSLVALADNQDTNHSRAVAVSKWLHSHNVEVVFPNTAILEAITALKRVKNLPEKAQLINIQYLSGAFTLAFVDEATQRQASVRFGKTVSKKNTIFDCLVMETAIKFNTKIIFSFDNFFTKQGFELAGRTTQSSDL